MLRSKAFVKRTRKGNVVKVVKEHYLRDDIACGVDGCTLCPTIADGSSATHVLLDKEPRSVSKFGSHYIVPDTNVFMNQIDIMEHKAVCDVIVLQTVLEEVRHLKIAIYNRLRAIISDPERRFFVFSNEHHRETYIEKLPNESPNDRNDRAIRTATKWYSEHLAKLAKGGRPVAAVMLSDDVANCSKAREDRVLACSVRDYVGMLTDFPELADMVAEGENSVSSNEKNFSYDEHLTPLQIQSGIKAGRLQQGTLSISLHNFLEGSIYGMVDGQERTITILGRKNLNRAMQGDVVAVELLPKEEWKRSPSTVMTEEDEEKVLDGDESEKIEAEAKAEEAESTDPPQPTGKVVGIVKRGWRPFCGFIDKQSIATSEGSTLAHNVFFRSIDRRIPKIKIRTRQAHTLVGQRIVVAVDSWPKQSLHPIGHFVKALGSAGDKQTETEVLLLEHEVPHHEFSKTVLADLPIEGDTWVVQDEHLKNRIDLRGLDVCSIDPPGCTDIDDALHVRSLENGNYEVGVHIADVTYFVKPGTAMDTEAANRGTTVYLVDKRIDMLPGLLGTNLCSLRSDVDRLAFSCIWELNPEAEIVDVKFTKSVIRSRFSFTYDEAQNRIDDLRLQDDITKGLRHLNSLAKKLRARRMERGALTLASPEVRFQLENDSQDPVDVEMKELKETNALVEEFMLLANISVARRIHAKFPDSSMLRRHPKPPDTNFEPLQKALEPFGVALNVETSKALADSLDKAVLENDPYFNKLLRIMTTRCMMQALYFSSGTVPEVDYWHYGLATEIYTHFTSPIRRYSDVIVHRQLSACIDADLQYGEEITNKVKMQELCDVLNHRNRMAQLAARSSVELYTNLFFKGKSQVEEGYVVRVLKNGFITLVPKYGIEGIVYTSAPASAAVAEKASDSPLVYNPQTGSLDAPHGETSIRLFARVEVCISVDEDLQGGGAGGMRQKLKMELVEPFVPGLSVDKRKETTPVVSNGIQNEVKGDVKADKKRRASEEVAASGKASKNSNKKKKN
ncbi:uncharacterized protein VTP21DRAFT_4124 [Calcarisporiella thermophila]|uniref:uncharacterized protein n=1 Tax=Calcarisporiella thermophila TaxID=911321 RepID=UPI0037437398